MIRTKGEAGTGNIVAAMRHARLLDAEIAAVQQSDDRAAMATRVVDKYFELDREVVTNLGTSSGATPFEMSRSQIEVEVTELMDEVAKLGRLPVVTFTAGGIATPADAALMMQFGMDGLFVGSGIFKSDDPAERARAIVEATAHFDDPHVVAKVSGDLGSAMDGLEEAALETKMASRGH
jgi:pyridoxal 5'-phosphate synthase pdxS subunit